MKNPLAKIWFYLFITTCITNIFSGYNGLYKRDTTEYTIDVDKKSAVVTYLSLSNNTNIFTNTMTNVITNITPIARSNSIIFDQVRTITNSDITGLMFSKTNKIQAGYTSANLFILYVKWAEKYSIFPLVVTKEMSNTQVQNLIELNSQDEENIFEKL